MLVSLRIVDLLVWRAAIYDERRNIQRLCRIRALRVLVLPVLAFATLVTHVLPCVLDLGFLIFVKLIKFLVDRVTYAVWQYRRLRQRRLLHKIKMVLTCWALEFILRICSLLRFLCWNSSLIGLVLKLCAIYFVENFTLAYTGSLCISSIWNCTSCALINFRGLFWICGRSTRGRGDPILFACCHGFR